jgi:hypothetical protein
LSAWEPSPLLPATTLHRRRPYAHRFVNHAPQQRFQVQAIQASGIGRAQTPWRRRQHAAALRLPQCPDHGQQGGLEAEFRICLNLSRHLLASFVLGIGSLWAAVPPEGVPPLRAVPLKGRCPQHAQRTQRVGVPPSNGARLCQRRA